MPLLGDPYAFLCHVSRDPVNFQLSSRTSWWQAYMGTVLLALLWDA